MKRIALGLVAVLVGLVLLILASGLGLFGSHQGPGEVTRSMRPGPELAARAAAQRDASPPPARDRQILFGDLHVHTTFSFDAHLFSLPMLSGEGAHPPADACDFARFCAGLDFWSINDHAESLTPAHWEETVASIRQCNAVAADAAVPDSVAFLGWEWSQAGSVPEEHYGHKNVVLASTDEGKIPTRPIAARMQGGGQLLVQGALALAQGKAGHDWARYTRDRTRVPRCPDGVPVRELPDDCREVASTPAQLFAKLRDWGHPALVIPHGTSWGVYTPQGSSWDKQLVGPMHDEEHQTLIEIYSGHGNSEQYRDWRAVEFALDGSATCPPERDDFEPPCVRAGKIVKARCEAAGLEAAECDRRADEARGFTANSGPWHHATIPGGNAQEWGDSGQCRDCFQPTLNYRPGGTAQYMLALGSFSGGKPRRFRFGFMASSDNHFARAGSGYKETRRIGMTESVSDGSAPPAFVFGARGQREPRAVAVDPRSFTAGISSADTERATSYLYTGGLVAVHADARDRDAIWRGLRGKEVYGTSGRRMLLWFDLLNPPDGPGPAPMGSEVESAATPRFRVRAVGSLEQMPGCPESASAALGAERLRKLCLGECYHPSDTRRPITRVEVVRIRPRISPLEDPADLIEDPWRVLPCAGDAEGCTVEFEDPEHAGAGRDSVYYVRAVEAPAPLINGQPLAGPDGEIVTCPSEGADDDCLGEAEPLAWSSPIYVDHPRTRPTAIADAIGEGP